MGILSACPKSHCTTSPAPDSWDDDTQCHTQHCFPLLGSSLNAFSWETFEGGCHEMAQSQYVRQSIQDWWKERIPYVILYPPHMYHGKWSFSGFLIAKSLSCSILVLLRLIVVFHSLSFGLFSERLSHVWGQANLILAVSLLWTSNAPPLSTQYWYYRSVPLHPVHGELRDWTWNFVYDR